MITQSISLTYGFRDSSASINAVEAVINWPTKGLRGNFRKVLAASLFPKEGTEWTDEGTEKLMAFEGQAISRFMNVCKAFLIDLP